MKYEILSELFTDDKGFKWDRGANITEMQISDENAKVAITHGELKLLEGEFAEITIN